LYLFPFGKSSPLTNNIKGYPRLIYQAFCIAAVIDAVIDAIIKAITASITAVIIAAINLWFQISIFDKEV